MVNPHPWIDVRYQVRLLNPPATILVDLGFRQKRSFVAEGHKPGRSPAFRCSRGITDLSIEL